MIEMKVLDFLLREGYPGTLRILDDLLKVTRIAVEKNHLADIVQEAGKERRLRIADSDSLGEQPRGQRRRQGMIPKTLADFAGSGHKTLRRRADRDITQRVEPQNQYRFMNRSRLKAQSVACRARQRQRARCQSRIVGRSSARARAR